MTYTAIVNLAKRQVDLYNTGDQLFYRLADDTVITEASYNVSGDNIIIAGKQREFKYNIEPVILSEQEFENTLFRKDRFVKEEQAHITFSWKFPFVKRTVSTIYSTGSGAISYTEHKPVNIKLPLSQTVVVSHSKDK